MADKPARKFRFNVIDEVMEHPKEYREGKVFDVLAKYDKTQVEPVVFGGRAVLDETVVTEGETRQKSRTITFVTTTTGKDRHGTRVRTDGIDVSNYEKNPIFLWGHDGYGGWFSVPDINHVIGKTVAIRKAISQMEQDVEFTPADMNPRGDQAFKMVQAKFLSATSIGFIPRQIVVELEDEREVPVILRCELLETSLVPIPSNPEVSALVREMAGVGGDPRGLVIPKELLALDKEHLETFVTLFNGRNFSRELEQPAAPPADAADNGVVTQQGAALRRAIVQWQFELVKRGLAVAQP